MRKTLLTLTFLGLILSCDKLKELAKAKFNMVNDTVEIIVPASGTGLTYSKSESFKMNLDSILKAENIDLSQENIKSFKLNSAELTLLNADSANNFANIQTCIVSFYSNTNMTPTEIATLASNPNTYATTLNVPVNQTIDVKEYAKTANTFYYTVSGTLRKATSKDLRMKIKINYAVEAGL
jgi:hypothetical protein